ncbi:MAG: hypothetical protein Q9196_004291 [Gyalolechia fulgens]
MANKLVELVVKLDWHGPKGSRAKIISELRLSEGQKKADHPRQESMHNHGSLTSSPTLLGLLTDELIDGCVHFYFTNMYQTMPILHDEQLWRLIAEMHNSVEAYCLLCSFCALLLIQPGIELEAGGAINTLDGFSSNNTSLGRTLLEGALRRRKEYDYIENPSVNAVITSFFVFGCFSALDKHNTAWFHLREATTLAQTIGMQDERTYVGVDWAESARMRRLFWLLYVTERSAIHFMAFALSKALVPQDLE